MACYRQHPKKDESPDCHRGLLLFALMPGGAITRLRGEIINYMKTQEEATHRLKRLYKGYTIQITPVPLRTGGFTAH